MSSPIPYEFDDRDIVSPGYSVALLSRYPLARLGRQFAPVDADDCAPGLEAMPPQAGLAVAVVFTDAGMVHQLQRDGYRVCDVAKWGALPVTAEMMEDAGLPRHAAAFRRWHDVDCDRPSPGDDITRAAFDAMDRQASPLRTDR